jgi:hypothetical protein
VARYLGIGGIVAQRAQQQGGHSQEG